MTEEEYRQKMREAGWDEKETDEHLNRFHKCKKENDLLTLEMWRIPVKPSIFWASSHRETDE